MKKQNFVRILYRELNRMIRKNPTLSIVIICLGIVDSFFLLGNTVFTKRFFEDMTLASENKLRFCYVLSNFILLCIIILGSDILNAIINYLIDKQRMHITKGIMEDFFLKIKKLNTIRFEDSATLDIINKAKVGVNNSVNVLIRTEIILSNYVVYFVMIFVYLFTLHPLLSLVLVFIFIPTFISYKFRSSIQNKTEEKLAIQRRRMIAYESYIGDRKFFKETRHLEASEFFKRKFLDSLKQFNSLSLSAFNKINSIKLLLNVINLIGFILILTILYYLTSIKAISVGEIGAVLITVTTIYDRMNELFNFQIADLSDSYNGLYNLTYLLELKEETKTQVLEGDNLEISIENVKFKYPNAKNNALYNISFNIKQGETIAIVGENGCGKTTLSKLIGGLYSPSEGDVKYNNVSIHELNLNSLYKRITIVFQNFQQYALSVKENLSISDINNINIDNVKEGLKSVDLLDIVKNLNEDLDTMLSKEFGGIDLSLGQWQRLAIARANYKKSSLIIFDEPTASLDPLQEMEIIQKFIKESKDKTRILVTHRIGAARLADKIITMKNGQIAEIGTHEELLKKQGEYANLYINQKQWYE